MRLEVIRAPMDEFFPGVFAIGVGSKLRPPAGEAGLLDWRLNGAVSSLVQQGLIGGKVGEKVLYWSRRRRSKVYIFGTGAASRPSGRTVANCAESMVTALLDAGECDVVFLAEHMLGLEEDVERAMAFLSGLLGAGKNEPEPFSRFRLMVTGDAAEIHYEALRKAILRRGKDAETVELVLSDNAPTLQAQ